MPNSNQPPNAKIEVPSFLETVISISARNCGITRERWVIKARRCLYRVSRRILRKDGGIFAKIFDGDIGEPGTSRHLRVIPEF